MTPAELIEAFDTLADAPDGIARLRELVLQLAVRGQLVPQDPKDEPASVLRTRIEREAAVARPSRVSVHFEDEKPFDTPESWEWVFLGQAMNLVNGMAFKPTDWSKSGLPIVRIQNLNNADAPFNFCDYEVKEKYYVGDGDLLLSWSGTPGTSFGAFIWDRGRAVLNQHIFRCEPRGGAYGVQFLRLAINSRLGEMIERAHGAVGLRHVTRGQLDGLWLPLPPLAEQHRIVAKVDELMGLLDRLEEAKAKRDETRAALRDAALAALRDANDVDEVHAAWSRIAENMDDLFTAPADVAPLRQTILQLAVRGRLVPQDPTDEPASALLERIAKEKARLIRSGAVPKPRALQERPDGFEPPFDLQSGWTHALLDDLASYVQRGKSPEYDDGSPIRVVSQKCVQWAGFDLARSRGLAPRALHGYGPERFLRAGDLLWNSTGTGTVGRVNLMPDVAEDQVVADSHVTVVRLLCMEPRFVYAWLASPAVQDRIEEMTTGTTKQQELNLSTVRLQVVPVPPLGEQRRIVEKLDDLMSFCDQLEARLGDAVDAHAAFASAAVHHVEVPTGSARAA